jgi:hypothetical protein
LNSTARLALPLLAAGQAQKEIFHNEALQTLDILAAPSVEALPMDSPPTTPSIGACFIVASLATGAWAGKDGSIACYTAGGWRHVTPSEGMAAFVKNEATWAVYRGGTWEIGVIRGSNLILEGQQVVGERSSAIASPVGGSTIDAEARSVIGQILSALRNHGLIET